MIRRPEIDNITWRQANFQAVEKDIVIRAGSGIGVKQAHPGNHLPPGQIGYVPAQGSNAALQVLQDNPVSIVGQKVEGDFQAPKPEPSLSPSCQPSL